MLRLFYRDSDELDGKAADNAPQRGAERRGQIEVSIDHRRRGQARVDLNQLHVPSFLGKKTLVQSNNKWRIGIAPARIRNSYLCQLRRRAVVDGQKEKTRERHATCTT